MVGKSDFALFSALNFCKDNAFFRYKKTNEKTLIKKAISGANFSFFDAENVLYYFWLVINWYLIYYVFVKCFGDKLGRKICYPKDKKSKYKVYPLMFFRPIFLSLGKKNNPVLIIRWYSKHTANIIKFSLFFVYLFKF